MSSTTFSARLCALLFVLLFSSAAFGGATKVDVCHVPPSEPDNSHSISISENALQKHLDHGDYEGECTAPSEDSCPCFTPEDVATLGDPVVCPTDGSIDAVFYDTDSIACVGTFIGGVFACSPEDNPGDPATSRCSLFDETANDPNLSNEGADTLTADQEIACREIIAVECELLP